MQASSIGQVHSVSPARSENSSASDIRVEPAREPLLRRLRRDDAGALDELIQAFWMPLVAYAARMLHSEDAAEDIAQEVFVRVWERRHEWKDGGSERALLYRIARNLCLNEQRRRAIRLKWRMGRSVDRQTAPPANQAMEERVMWEAATRAIESLPPRRREAFILARFHQLSYAEIADTMEITERTVANQISSALAQLRHALGDLLDEVHSDD